MGYKAIRIYISGAAYQFLFWGWEGNTPRVKISRGLFSFFIINSKAMRWDNLYAYIFLHLLKNGVPFKPPPPLIIQMSGKGLWDGIS